MKIINKVTNKSQAIDVKDRDSTDYKKIEEILTSFAKEDGFENIEIKKEGLEVTFGLSVNDKKVFEAYNIVLTKLKQEKKITNNKNNQENNVKTTSKNTTRFQEPTNLTDGLAFIRKGLENEEIKPGNYACPIKLVYELGERKALDNTICVYMKKPGTDLICSFTVPGSTDILQIIINPDFAEEDYEDDESIKADINNCLSPEDAIELRLIITNLENNNDQLAQTHLFNTKFKPLIYKLLSRDGFTFKEEKKEVGKIKTQEFEKIDLLLAKTRNNTSDLDPNNIQESYTKLTKNRIEQYEKKREEDTRRRSAESGLKFEDEHNEKILKIVKKYVEIWKRRVFVGFVKQSFNDIITQVKEMNANKKNTNTPPPPSILNKKLSIHVPEGFKVDFQELLQSFHDDLQIKLADMRFNGDSETHIQNFDTAKEKVIKHNSLFEAKESEEKLNLNGSYIPDENLPWIRIILPVGLYQVFEEENGIARPLPTEKVQDAYRNVFIKAMELGFEPTQIIINSQTDKEDFFHEIKINAYNEFIKNKPKNKKQVTFNTQEKYMESDNENLTKQVTRLNNEQPKAPPPPPPKRTDNSTGNDTQSNRTNDPEIDEKSTMENPKQINGTTTIQPPPPPERPDNSTGDDMLSTISTSDNLSPDDKNNKKRKYRAYSESESDFCINTGSDEPIDTPLNVSSKSNNPIINNGNESSDSAPCCCSMMLSWMTNPNFIKAVALVVIIAGVTAALIGFGVIPGGSGFTAFLASLAGKSNVGTAKVVVASLGIAAAALTTVTMGFYSLRKGGSGSAGAGTRTNDFEPLSKLNHNSSITL